MFSMNYNLIKILRKKTMLIIYCNYYDTIKSIYSKNESMVDDEDNLEHDNIFNY